MNLVISTLFLLMTAEKSGGTTGRIISDSRYTEVCYNEANCISATRMLDLVFAIVCFQDLATMGPQEDYIEMVLTCEGDFYDPNFHVHLEDFSNRLQDLIAGGNYCNVAMYF